MTTTSAIAEHTEQPVDYRARPPVGPAFATFIGTIVVLWALITAERVGSLSWPMGSPVHLGVVAGTTFAIAGLLAAHRAAVMRNRWAAAIAIILIGPGALWTWTTFVTGAPPSRIASTLVVAIASGVGMVLLIKGFRLAHWLEVFGGLGCCGLTIVAGTVQLDPTAADKGPVALLAAVAAMCFLYGLLVDLELSEHRSLIELVESRRRIERDVAQVEELLHDLRGGLLAIEAAIGSFDGDLAGPLRAEAARLRRLTLTGARSVGRVDLADRVEELVATRRAAGVDVRLEASEATSAWGEESELLAIVDNLLTNAERHGDPGPITVEISGNADGDGIRLAVRNRGRLPSGDPDAIFTRGVTTHPDGQGLGLARARLLAEVNGADLRVGPAETGHTTFVLNLQTPAAVAA